jgi:hypothetical protein
MSTFSICIKRTSAYVFQEEIAATFNQLFGVECVERIDLIERIDQKSGQPFHIAFVHFTNLSRGLENPTAETFFSKIEKSGMTKVIYNDPWFFQCYRVLEKTTTTKSKSGPRLATEEDEEAFKVFRSGQNTSEPLV